MKLNTRGDTIVEVLIAMVVVSSVLVGSFSITNISFKQIRMSQERSEAQKLAESEAESLNRMVALKFNHPTEDLLTRTDLTDGFCKSTTDFTATDASLGSSCKSGPDGRYKTVIKRVGGTPPLYNFQINVSWDSVSGRPEQLDIFYRVGTPS